MNTILNYVIATFGMIATIFLFCVPIFIAGLILQKKDDKISETIFSIVVIPTAILVGAIGYVFPLAIGPLILNGLPVTKENILMGIDYGAFMLVFFLFLFLVGGILAEALYQDWAKLNLDYHKAATIATIFVLLIQPFLSMYIADWISGSHIRTSLIDIVTWRSPLYNPILTPLKFTLLWSKIATTIYGLGFDVQYSSIISGIIIIGSISAGLVVIYFVVKYLIMFLVKLNR